jgi:hypothetical protein
VAAAVEAGGAGVALASPTTPAAGPAEALRPLDWQGTRRALRVKMKKGAEIQLDGNPAAVVDVSIVGAQVLSGTILRPNQKVRVTIPNEDTQFRCRGTIAWAKFEIPKASAPPVYRAGVEFLDADAAAVDQFTARHRQ